MEQLFDKIELWSHGVLPRGYLMSLQCIDWVVIVFVGWGVIYGMKRGLMREIVLCLETAAIAYVLFEYFGPMADGLQTEFPVFSKVYADMIAYILILVGLVIVMKFLDAVIFSRCLQTSLPAPLRILGGAFFGAVHFAILLSLLCQACLLVPVASLQNVFREGNSHYGSRISKIAPDVYEGVGKGVRFVASQCQRFLKTEPPAPAGRKGA